ncbi:MAG: succinate dehydrogenase cytochrome b558 subunit [Phycisphaerae bacterium]
MLDSRADGAGASQRHYFVIRRLHSLLGLIPLGVFVLVHFATNASILLDMRGGSAFQWAVSVIHLPERLHRGVLITIEVVGIFLPLLFHMLLGIQIALTGRPNAQAYRYGGNVRYTLQRVTAYIALVFIMYHVWQVHWLGKGLGGGGAFAFEDVEGSTLAAVSTAARIQSAWWIAPIYLVGIVATVFHLANGVWTALITWGITIRPATQRASGYVCAVFGVALTLVGLGALRGFKTFDTQRAAATAGPVPVRVARADATDAGTVAVPGARVGGTPSSRVAGDAGALRASGDDPGDHEVEAAP